VSQMKTELHKVGDDPLAKTTLSILNTYKVKGRACGGQYPGVLLRVCSAISKVWFYEDAWHA
jgi:hypothetical protein